MNDEPDIVKLLKEEEKLRKQQSVIQSQKSESQEKTPDEPVANESNFDEDFATIKTIDGDESRFVTKPEKISTSLNESEDRYKALFNSPFQLIYLHDFKGKFIDANPTALKLLGYTRQEISSLNISSLLDRAQLGKAIKTLNYIRIYGCQKEPMEYRLKTKSGVFIDIETTGEIVYRNGKPYAIQGIAHDITKQKKIEKAIKESENKFRSLFENFPDLIMETDDEGNILAINPTMAESLGAPFEKLVGKNIFDILPREIAEQRAKIARRAFEERKNQESEEERTGQYFHNIYVPIINPDGKRTIQLIARNVTAQKKAAVKIKESEAQLSNAVKIAHLGPWEYDVINDLFTFNDSFYTIFRTTVKEVGGYTMSSTDYAKRFVHPEDLSVVSSEIRKAIETDDPNFNRQLEHRIIYANGDVGYISVRFFIVKDEKGRTVRTYGVNQDITERKKVEEKLTEMHNLLNETGKMAKVGGWEVDIATGQVTWTEEVYRIYGIDPSHKLHLEEVINYFAQESISMLRQAIKDTVEKGTPFDLELQLINAKGEKIWTRAIGGASYSDGKVKKLRGTFQDINEQKKAELTLKQNEEKLQRMMDASPDNITISDLNGIIIDCNQATADMHGFSVKEDIIGKNAFELIVPRDHARAIENLKKTLEVGSIKNVEYTFLKKDGSEFPAEISASIIRDTSGKPHSFVGIIKDITERKKVEEDLQRTIDKLKETQSTIGRQNVQLKKLDKIKSDFLNVTSHELRTPMAAIKGYIQMISKGTLGTITDEQKKALDVILRNSNRLDRLIQDILDISRLESGTMKFVTRKTAIEKMIKEIVETMQVAASLKRIQIHTELGECLPELNIDKDRIIQVVVNILNNAIKFSPEASNIIVRVKKQEDNILFEVRDYGRGIPKEHHEKIFQTFYQVDSNTDTKFGGAGLGLAICYGIVTAHGGRIWVESTGKPNEGSVFKFILPIESVFDIEKRFRGADVFGLGMNLNGDENSLHDDLLDGANPLKKSGIPSLSSDENVNLNKVSLNKNINDPFKKYFEHSHFLSETAIDFAQFPIEGDIFRYIDKKIQEIINGAYLTFTYHDEKTDKFYSNKIIEYEENLTKFFQIIGKYFQDMKFDFGENHIGQKLHQGKLIHIFPSDFNRFIMSQFPEELSPIINKKINMDEIYTIGLISEKKLFGNVLLIAPKDMRIENPEVIEIFINQAALAIQRNNVMKELNILHNDLVIQNSKLQKLNEIKTTFLKITSHELRTPITLIKGYTQMLMKKNLGEINEEQKKSLQVILRNTDRLDQVIQNMLDTTNLQSGTLKFIPSKMSPLTLVKETIQAIQSFASEKNMTINVNLEKDLPDLIVDGERIKQVIKNLLDNAIKFSPEGSVINVKVKKEKNDVLFELQDFGQGIPKDKQKMIFDPFYQADSGDDRKFSGIGLSLSLSKGIVVSNGGKIWVESIKDKGSTFRFTLPIKSLYENRWEENIAINKEIITT
jgi:PAS domain S-box-containing protein